MKLKNTDNPSQQTLRIIEVIYALPLQQNIIQVDAEENWNVEQVIEHSGILKKYPEIDLSKNKVGIFSKVCQLTDSLYDGDRIEIYRSLIIDPKEARKNRALKK